MKRPSFISEEENGSWRAGQIMHAVKQASCLHLPAEGSSGGSEQERSAFSYHEAFRRIMLRNV